MIRVSVGSVQREALRTDFRAYPGGLTADGRLR
jgi:hypothetical protein